METALIYKKTEQVKFKAPLWWTKWTHYENWPLWLMYIPPVFYWMALAIRSRSLTYFTAANPGIELGGFCGESKINILNKIDKQYLPVTVFIPQNTSVEHITYLLNKHQLDFPIICKPNVGERGTNVEKINSAEELKAYFSSRSFDCIIQELIPFEIELGILYYHFPDGTKSGITSIVKKEFLTVTGDGYSSILDLLKENQRGSFQLDKMKNKLGDKMNTVLSPGEKLLLEPIGNHCRGTKFLNGNDLINEELVKVFDTIAKNMDGFYFGRFDLKVKSLEDLYDGKNIRIMEVNGTTSEPAHIYDPEYKLVNAYRDIFYNMKLVSIIAKQNNKKGIAYTPFKEFYRVVKNHLRPLP